MLFQNIFYIMNLTILGDLEFSISKKKKITQKFLNGSHFLKKKKKKF